MSPMAPMAFALLSIGTDARHFELPDSVDPTLTNAFPAKDEFAEGLSRLMRKAEAKQFQRTYECGHGDTWQSQTLYLVDSFTETASPPLWRHNINYMLTWILLAGAGLALAAAAWEWRDRRASSMRRKIRHENCHLPAEPDIGDLLYHQIPPPDSLAPEVASERKFFYFRFSLFSFMLAVSLICINIALINAWSEQIGLIGACFLVAVASLPAIFIVASFRSPYRAARARTYDVTNKPRESVALRS